MISSDTLPEFEELEKEYAAAMAGIEAEETKDKPKKGRKKISEVESLETESEDITVEPEEMSDIFAPVFNSYYSRKGKPELSEIETKALGRSLAKVVNKWAPKIGGRWKEEFGLFICLSAIMGSRYEKKEEKKNVPTNIPEKEAKTAGDSNTIT